MPANVMMSTITMMSTIIISLNAVEIQTPKLWNTQGRIMIKTDDECSKALLRNPYAVSMGYTAHTTTAKSAMQIPARLYAVWPRISAQIIGNTVILPCLCVERRK